jgi:DNA-binding response OmpR family regulator
MRLLLCEDDDQLARGLTRALRRAGHEVIRVISIADALERLRDQGLPDMALVDLTLPDGHGSQLVTRLREYAEVGIIIITARGDEQSRVLGLRAGADDYVVKPFGLAELMARVDAVGRRTRPLRDQRPSEELHLGSTVFDVAARTLSRTVSGTGSGAGSATVSHTVDGALVGATDPPGSGEAQEPIRLTRKESAVLAMIAARPGTVVARSSMLEAIWPDGPERASRSLDTHIGSLRTKLPPEVTIETVYGTGYRLVVAEEPGA